MSNVQRIAKNSGIIIVGDVIFRVISLAVIICLARYLGTVGFGKYSFVFAYLAFFDILLDLGLQQILVREMSRDASFASKLIGNAYIIRLILAVFGVVLSIIVINLLSYPIDTTTYVYIASFTLPFISFSYFYSTIFQANLKMEYNVIAKLVFKIISAILIIQIIFSQGTLMQVILVLVFSRMVETLINYICSRKFVRAKFEIDFKLWRYLFKESLPLALASVIWIIYFRIDVVMLSMMQGDASVGIYSAAYKLSEPLSFIPAALMISLFPIMAASFKTSEERLVKSYRFAIRYILIIILPIAISITIIADKIVFLIYGAEFVSSAAVLQILIWALVFTSTNSVLLNLLVSVDKQKLYAVSIAICAIVNVVFNFILIPMWSYNGAAIATVATNIVLFGVSFYFVSKHLHVVLPVHKILLKPLMCGLIMGAFAYYFINVNIFLLIPLAAAVYLVALLASKTFNKEDWYIIKKVIRKT